MRVISAGIPDTAMPPGDYTASELAGLVAYLRTMGDFDPSDVLVGDAAQPARPSTAARETARAATASAPRGHASPPI